MSLFTLLVTVAVAVQADGSARYSSAPADGSAAPSQPSGISALLGGGYGEQPSGGQSPGGPPSGVSPMAPPPTAGRSEGIFPSGTGNATSAASSPPPDISPIGGGAAPPRTQGAATNPISPFGSSPAGTVYAPGALRSSSAPAQSATSESPNEPRLKPVGMMRAMIAPRSDARLGGQWVTLDDVVAGASSRTEQSDRIEAYWDLCSSVADYFLGLREQQEMRNLRQVFPGNSPTLNQVEKDLAVRSRYGRARRAGIAVATGQPDWPRN